MLATSVLRPDKARYDHSDDGDFARFDPDDPRVDQYGLALARAGTVLDATLSVYEPHPVAARPGRLPGCSRALAARLTRKLVADGVRVSAGTDYPAGPNDPWPSLLKELHALVHDAGFTPTQALAAATRNGAAAAGQSRDYGGLGAGAYADMVLLRRNPLDNIDNLRSVVLTVKRGQRYPRADYHFAPIPGARP